MGTETYHKTLGRYQGGNHGVKKNNPQMGTETRLFARIDLLRIRRLVKLNNPLMGTETYIYGLR